MVDQNTPIEALFHEKIMLYRELVAVLNMEKTHIIDSEVDGLWRASDRKQAIAAKIEANRGCILDILSKLNIHHGMTVSKFSPSQVARLVPTQIKSKITGSLITLLALKEEIESITRDNKQYIESFLSVLDDLIGVLAGSEKEAPAYTPVRNPRVDNSPKLFHQEV